MKPTRMVEHWALLLPSRPEIQIFPIVATSLFYLGFFELIRKSLPLIPICHPSMAEA
jgi:hypothetical protein